MPTTIKDHYDLKRGDLIYGIGEQINKYLDKLLADGVTIPGTDRNQSKQDFYAAINTYNRAIGFNSFTFNGDTLEVDTDKIKSSAGVVDLHTGRKGYTKDYVSKLLASPKFSPASVAGDVTKDTKLQSALKKGRDDFDKISEDDQRAAAKELAIRRSCKFGIEYVLTLDKGATIHYVMDGMDMLKVAQKDWFDKTIPKSGAAIKFRKISICTTELRYLFRNWGRISKTGRVKFYHNFIHINPPWTQDFFKSTRQWADYAKHLVEKKLADKKKSIVELHTAAKYKEAVEEFHKVSADVSM